jgi:hypothetical protein
MAILSGSTGPVPSSSAFSIAQAEDRMRTLPSHGWTSGWTGRRDRAMLVLTAMAALDEATIAGLTVGDITVADGVATIRTPSGTTVLDSNEDDLICAPCALARWLRALDMTVLYPSGRVLAAVIARSAPLTANSPHLCEGTLTVTPDAKSLPVLPTNDVAEQPRPIRPPLRGIPTQRTDSAQLIRS